MSVTVKIPTQLRSLTDGASTVDAAGGSVVELIDDIEKKHPGIKERIMDEDGSLRRFVNIYLGDEDVRFLDGLNTSVPEGGSIAIIPAVAGGSD